MQVLRLPPRHHPKAEITCPPLRAGAVCPTALKAGATALLSGSVLTFPLATGAGLLRHPAVAAAYALACGSFLLSVLWLAHAVNALRRPVVLKVARGELTVTWPFLLSRRTRTLRTSDITAVDVGVSPGGTGNPRPTGRLVIRRRHRRPLRVPARRPLDEVNRAAAELRMVLHV